jgi:hypothetical protein
MFSRLRPVTGLFLALFVVTNSSAGPQLENPSIGPNASAPAITNVNVTIDALTNRHSISTYIYGCAYPKDAPTISDGGLTVVRWGGNATSRYNWKTFTYNAANDWYFEDFGYTEIGDADSSKYIQDVKAAGSNPLMTMFPAELRPQTIVPLLGQAWRILPRARDSCSLGRAKPRRRPKSRKPTAARR